jgi:hypothetical protein
MNREMLEKMIAQYKAEGNTNAVEYWTEGLKVMLSQEKEELISF